MWQNSLGHCVLKAEFPKGRKELGVSLFQVGPFGSLCYYGYDHPLNDTLIGCLSSIVGSVPDCCLDAVQ